MRQVTYVRYELSNILCHPIAAIGVGERVTWYFGFVEHISGIVRADFIKTNVRERSSLARIEAFIASLPDDLETGEPVECCGVYDADAGIQSTDALLMWRIPVFRKFDPTGY